MPATRNNYSLQSDTRLKTMTVGDLLKSIEGLAPETPVVILSPRFGTFGSEMPYGIAAIEETIMPRMEQTYPASEYEDDETGETRHIEEETQVWPEWRGVILQGR